MKKSLTIIGVVVIIIVIIFICAWIWVDGLKEDTAITKKKMDEVLDAYPKFNEEVDNFSKLRNQLYESKEDLYLETLRDNAASWNTFMENYKNSIMKVENTALILKKNCAEEYGDVNVSSKCTTFKANYEAAHNYYISDVKMYNQMVDEYDVYNAEHGNGYAKVNKASYGPYDDYIDYDKDGEYFGKDEVVADER